MSAMTKKEWMEYLEKTWDAAQKEAWSEPQFECPRCGHCCQIRQAAQQAVEVMDAHMMRADTEEFYEAKEALRQALDMLNEIADDVYCDQKLEGVITALRQALVDADDTSQKRVDEMVRTEHNKQIEIAKAYERGWNAALAQQEPVAWISEGGDVSRSKRYMDEMGFKCNPLYTAPPKQWVGLTDEDYKELSKIAFVEVIEKIERVLKEKNA